MSPEPKLKEKKKGSPDSGRELSTPPARERAGPIPADFSITPEIREWARKRGYEPYLEAHLEYLKDWAPGQRKASWEATFRNCIRADWGGIRRQARLAAQRGEAPAHSLHLQWWKHDDGIKARAAELRVAKRDDEDWIVFKARVFIAAGEGPWIDERDTTTFRVVRALQARQEARA